MSKVYVIGEKNGQKYVGHMTKRDAAWMLNGSKEITKAEYRRHRSAGVPSWGERVTAIAKLAARQAKAERAQATA